MENSKDLYCHPNGVLKNKLGIIDSHDSLNYAEGKITLNELIINQEKILKLDALQPSSLFKIHEIIFDKVFDWAGKPRTVSISKEGFRFANPQFINSLMNELFNKPMKTFSDIIFVYNELNIIHPFRDGNGRATRVWLNLALQQVLNKNIAFDEISRKQYLDAMRSLDNKKQEKIFKKALINLDVKTFASLWARNAYESYYYEGYDVPHYSEK